MSHVLKSGSAELDRAVGSFEMAQPHAQENDRTEQKNDNAAQQALETLAEENEGLLLLLEENNTELEAVRKSAFDQGQEAGLAQAADHSSEALALLEKNCIAAVSEFSDRLQSLEGLAVLLARAAIHKIIGDVSDSNQLVGSVIATQLKQIDDLSTVYITVSAVDFRDAEALDALVKRVGLNGAQFATSPSLETGGCKLKMRLGVTDIGLDTQLRNLDSIFEDMIAQVEK